MLSHPQQKLTIGCLICCLLALLVVGCRPKPCAEHPCVHGTCVDTHCECESIYEGIVCDTLSSAKFKGSLWYNNILCQNNSSYLNATVVDDPARVGGLLLYNVYRQGDSVFAVAHRDSLIVAEQAYGVEYIRGTGLYGGAAFTLEFTVRTTVGQETNCVAVFGH